VSIEKPPPPLPGDFSESPFGKATHWLSWVFITTVLLIIAAIPTFLLFIFLHTETPVALQNSLVLILSLALLGPALSAGLYSARANTVDENPSAFKAFWRGYRMNFFDVMRLWFPVCCILGLLTFAIGVANVTGLHIGSLGLWALILVTLIFGLLALILSTFISMSPGGIARLALLYIGRTWKGTFGIISLLIIAAFLASVVQGGVFLIPIFSGILVLAMYHMAKPMIADATEHYTVNSAAPHDVL